MTTNSNTRVQSFRLKVEALEDRWLPSQFGIMHAFSSQAHSTPGVVFQFPVAPGQEHFTPDSAGPWESAAIPPHENSGWTVSAMRDYAPMVPGRRDGFATREVDLLQASFWDEIWGSMSVQPVSGAQPTSTGGRIGQAAEGLLEALASSGTLGLPTTKIGNALPGNTLAGRGDLSAGAERTPNAIGLARILSPNAHVSWGARPPEVPIPQSPHPGDSGSAGKSDPAPVLAQSPVRQTGADSISPEEAPSEKPQGEPGPSPPFVPLRAGLLGDIFPATSTALEEGVQEFLQRIGSLSPQTGSLPPRGSHPGAWIILGLVASAVAFEVARRRLKRPGPELIPGALAESSWTWLSSVERFSVGEQR